MQKKTTDYTEFEAKFYPVEKDEYRLRLKKIGAKLITRERKMRRVLFTREFYPQIQCHYIRIRDEGDVVRLSAKTHAQPDGKLTDQKEVDVLVSDFEKTIKIFEYMGLKPTTYQETLRETWKFEDAEIAIDTWPGLLPFTEIEVGSEEEVKRIAQKLGFNWEKRIITSTGDIYMKIYGLTREEINKLAAHITFEDNPVKDLKAHKWQDVL